MSDWEDDVASEFGGEDLLMEEEPVDDLLPEQQAQVEVLPVEVRKWKKTNHVFREMPVL
jgi:hypothetical protein